MGGAQVRGVGMCARVYVRVCVSQARSWNVQGWGPLSGQFYLSPHTWSLAFGELKRTGQGDVGLGHNFEVLGVLGYS